MAEKVLIRCGDSACNSNLHCYQQARRIAARTTKRSDKAGNAGRANAGSSENQESAVGRVCRDCGAHLVDWERVGRRAAKDVDYTIRALKTELIRHHYWMHAELGPRPVNYARRKGGKGMRKAIEHHLRKSIGNAHPYRDGWQTPYGQDDVGQNVLFFAQHATASCCRKCAELWHSIPQGAEITEEALQYLTDLAMTFVLHRIPDLADESVHVPPIRKRRKRSPR